MEDCIHANPTAFLGENVEIVARQQRVRGFIPDLIVRNSSNETLVVEIQQNALDRYHLYKSLEYRDLILTGNAGANIRVILFCKTMDDRFGQLLITHSIELIQMERKQFVAIAIRETPEIVSAHLAFEDLGPGRLTKSAPEDVRLEFKPFDWTLHSTPSDVLAHLYREFGRLNADINTIPREYYRLIYWDIESLLDVRSRACA
jgi:hypothetical protein